MMLQLFQSVEDHSQDLRNAEWVCLSHSQVSRHAVVSIDDPTFSVLEQKVIHKGQQFLHAVEQRCSGTYQTSIN